MLYKIQNYTKSRCFQLPLSEPQNEFEGLSPQARARGREYERSAVGTTKGIKEGVKEKSKEEWKYIIQ